MPSPEWIERAERIEVLVRGIKYRASDAWSVVSAVRLHRSCLSLGLPSTMAKFSEKRVEKAVKKLAGVATRVDELVSLMERKADV